VLEWLRFQQTAIGAIIENPSPDLSPLNRGARRNALGDWRGDGPVERPGCEVAGVRNQFPGITTRRASVQRVR
jgi:hypothetical protein